MLDKQTKDIIRIIREIQGSGRYKGNDRLSRQYRDVEIQKQQGFTIK